MAGILKIRNVSLFVQFAFWTKFCSLVAGELVVNFSRFKALEKWKCEKGVFFFLRFKYFSFFPSFFFFLNGNLNSIIHTTLPHLWIVYRSLIFYCTRSRAKLFVGWLKFAVVTGVLKDIEQHMKLLFVAYCWNIPPVRSAFADISPIFLFSNKFTNPVTEIILEHEQTLNIE